MILTKRIVGPFWILKSNFQAALLQDESWKCGLRNFSPCSQVILDSFSLVLLCIWSDLRCITLHVCYFHHFHTLKNQKVDFINVKKMLHQSFYPSAGRILFITAMNGFPFSQKLSWGMASLHHFLVVHSRSYCFSGTGTHRLYYLVEKRCFFTHVVKNKCIH